MTRDRGYQRHPRITKRLEVTFSSGELQYRGILSNLSMNGLFIRTNRGFAPGTIIDVRLMISESTVSTLKGIVRRTVKSPIITAKNGMGVELIEKDDAYIDLVTASLEEHGRDTRRSRHIQTSEEFEIFVCTGCGIKNKVPRGKLSQMIRCGRCGTVLTTALP